MKAGDIVITLNIDMVEWNEACHKLVQAKERLNKMINKKVYINDIEIGEYISHTMTWDNNRSSVNLELNLSNIYPWSSDVNGNFIIHTEKKITKPEEIAYLKTYENYTEKWLYLGKGELFSTPAWDNFKKGWDAAKEQFIAKLYVNDKPVSCESVTYTWSKKKGK